MRYLLLALSAAVVFAAVSRTSSTSGQTPVPTPTETSPARPTVAAPVYDGRPCESGTLINDFVVLVDREPQPSCVQPFSPDESEVLYGLSPIPTTLRFRGLERSVVDGAPVVSAVYEAAGLEPGRATVVISLKKEALSKPYPVKVRLKVQASEAGFLPVPGLLLEPSAASQTGLWFGPSGLYGMIVESPGLTLDIRELAPLLTPIDLSAMPTVTPGPPSTGDSADGASRGDSGLTATAMAVVGLALTVLLAVLALRARRSDPFQRLG